MQTPAQQPGLSRNLLRRLAGVLPRAALPFHAQDVKPKWEETSLETRAAKCRLGIQPAQSSLCLFDSCLPLSAKEILFDGKVKPTAAGKELAQRISESSK